MRGPLGLFRPRRRALPETGLPPILAGALSLGLAGCAALVLRRSDRRLPTATPTDRSLHDRPVPRVGGLAILAGFIPVALGCPPVAGVPTPAWLPPPGGGGPRL